MNMLNINWETLMKVNHGELGEANPGICKTWCRLAYPGGIKHWCVEIYGFNILV